MKTTPDELERMLPKHDEALARIERNIEFVTNQQAQFYSDLQGLSVRLDGFEKAAEEARARQDASVSNLNGLVDGLINAQLRLVERVDRMADVTGYISGRNGGDAPR